jgi:hypothetical protein
MTATLANNVLHSSASLHQKQLASHLVGSQTALFAHHRSAAKHVIMVLNFLVELALSYALYPIATLAKQKALVLNALQALFSPKISLPVTIIVVSMDVPTVVAQLHAPNATQATH